MYLISRSSGLTMPIRDRKVHYNQFNGEVDHVDAAISIDFKPAGNVPPFAREAVQKLANWGVGLGQNEDPFTRCGAVDTEVEAELRGWDEETLAFVDNALLNSASCGIEFVVVEAPAAPKPWPKYDEIQGEDAAEQIAFYSDQLGIHAGVIKQYELENQNREDVVAKMDAILEKENEDVVQVISA